MENTSEIIESLKDKGIYKIDSYLSEEEILLCKKELKNYYEKIPDGSQFCDDGTIQENSYSPGKALVLFDPKKSIPFINSIFERDFFRKISIGYLGENCDRNLQTFSTYEYRKIEKENWPRNFFFHFDPYRALKFFLYLDHTSEKNGAFRAIPGSHNQCSLIRKNTHIHSLLKEKYLISHHPELSNLKEEDSEFFEGNSGTLLIFDTDIAHMGGIIKEKGMQRMTILNHNR